MPPGGCTPPRPQLPRPGPTDGPGLPSERGSAGESVLTTAGVQHHWQQSMVTRPHGAWKGHVLHWASPDLTQVNQALASTWRGGPGER